MKQHAEAHEVELMDLGVPALPEILRDITDRNRTSPFSFTGNKFEFRMCGSQQNLSDPNVVLNTAVAEQCERFCDYVDERAEEDFYVVAMRFVRHTFRDHRRSLLDGNGYSAAWEAEAARRGLPNLTTTPDALPAPIDPGNITLFEKYGVLNEAELHARYVAKAEQYAKLINIEANTMCDMARHLYVPAIMAYAGDIASDLVAKGKLGITSTTQEELCRTLSDGADDVWNLADKLEERNVAARAVEDPASRDEAYRDEVLPAMDALRAAVDALEVICCKDRWPVPSYNDMLFYV